MQVARVVGHAVSTVKHPTLKGWRLVLVQPLGASGQADGDPLLAIDQLGAWVGSRVIVSNDGASARQVVGARDSPVRWMTLGICDG
jgi:ethanolamine utilization protein EutN